MQNQQQGTCQRCGCCASLRAQDDANSPALGYVSRISTRRNHHHPRKAYPEYLSRVEGRPCEVPYSSHFVRRPGTEGDLYHAQNKVACRNAEFISRPVSGPRA
jgi:hypothetical protein